jgi:hypothetical protein
VVLHILGQEYIPTDHQDEGAITAYDLLLEAQVYDCLDRTYVDDRKPFVTYWRRIVSLALPVISYFLATI